MKRPPTLPTAKLEEDGRKSSKIRAIDQGTPYDAAGRHLRWLRQMKAGRYGRVTDALMIARTIKDGRIRYEVFYNGTGNSEVAHAMASVLVRTYTATGVEE